MSRTHRAAEVAFVFALFGCESREEANHRVNRVVAEAEARVYSEEAERMSEDFLAGDEAKRASKATVDEHTRLLGEARKQLVLANEKIEIQRKLVEANRDKLTRLKSETEATLANPRADAGLSREILRERLRGIVESLAKCTVALAEKHDGG